MSEVDVLVGAFAGTATRVLQSGNHHPVNVDVAAVKPVFERVTTTVNPLRNKLRTGKALLNSGTYLLEGDFAKAGEGFTLIAIRSDTVLNKVKDLGFIKKAQGIIDHIGSKISEIPLIGKHASKAIAIVPAAVAGVVSPSAETIGKVMVTTCGVAGGAVGASAGSTIPIAGTALGTYAGYEAATEFCAKHIGDAFHVKLAGSGILNDIKDIKDIAENIKDFPKYAKSEAEKFNVETIKNWDGIPLLQIPNVKRTLGRNDLPTA